MKNYIVFSFLLLLITSLSAQNLHLFIVVDFEDQNIGGRHDQAKIKSLGQDIATATGMNLKLYEYRRETTSTTQLANALNQVSCGNDDVVWFYYFGHGTNCDGTWPLFQVSDGVVCEKDIYNKLLSKNARLSLTMFDCCNTGNGIRPGGASKISGLPTVYTTLFKKSRGNIIVCGTRQGTYGWASPVTASQFTNNFVAALGSQNADNVSWNQVLEKTKQGVEAAAQNNCRNNPRCEGTWMQSPYFQVNVRTDQIDGGKENANAPEEKRPTSSW